MKRFEPNLAALAAAGLSHMKPAVQVLLTLPGRGRVATSVTSPSSGNETGIAQLVADVSRRSAAAGGSELLENR